MAETDHGSLQGGIDMLPKPTAGRLPLLVTGGSRQGPDWIAEHSDGWITYPRGALDQARVVADYRRRIAEKSLHAKPVSQSLYIDLQGDPEAAPRPIHLGFSSGTAFLLRYLEEIQSLGINHVAINLRFNQADTEATLARLAEHVLPHFPTQMEAP